MLVKPVLRIMSSTRFAAAGRSSAEFQGTISNAKFFMPIGISVAASSATCTVLP